MQVYLELLVIYFYYKFFDENEMSFGINDIYVIEPTITPYNASNKKVIYTSSNNSVASVDQSGISWIFLFCHIILLSRMKRYYP